MSGRYGSRYPRIRFFFLLPALMWMLTAQYGFPCDEVTHAYMTKTAIGLVEGQDLRDLLERHTEIVKFGSWLPDWGQYIDHPFADLSHEADPFLYAFLDYLVRPDVRREEEYPRLVALFLGTAAHIIQDQYYDTLFLETLKLVDSGISGDMEMGIINIARHGYLRLRVEPYLPVYDLAEVYAAAGGFETAGIDPGTFARDLGAGVRMQFLQLRALKLLSFLSSGLMAREMPWGSRNVMDAPGGIRDVARVTARYWESLWQQLSGMSPPLIVTAYPARGGSLATADSGMPSGRVTLVGSRVLSPTAFAEEAVSYIEGDGSVVRGLITGTGSGPSVPEMQGALVLQCVPMEPLDRARDYLLHIRSGAYGTGGERLLRPFRLPFSIPTDDPGGGFVGRGMFTLSRYALGVFLCVFCMAIGSVLFGVPAFRRLRHDAETADRFREGVSPASATGLLLSAGEWTLRVAGVGWFLAGALLTATGGSPFLSLIRSIF